ncbi:MAG: radical SAM protein [Candidatus Heteroscillospira sp.]|jgi:molybdenum cofactor biosynthesis enzyme MoaA
MTVRPGIDSPMLELCITAKPYFSSLYPEFESGGEMSLNQILDIAEAAAEAGFGRILLTGTEPLHHPEILDICYSVGRIREFLEFGVSTLGAPLRSMAPTLKGAGVNLLEIRLDTLQKVKYEFLAGGRLDDVRRGISAAERTGFLIRMVTRLIAGANDDEIYDFCDLVKRHCFEQWFVELPSGSENHMDSGCVFAARPRLEELDIRDGARRFRSGKDAGMICLASYEGLNRIRITSGGVLNSRRKKIALAGLSHSQLAMELRRALEPDKHISFGFEVIEE